MIIAFIGDVGSGKTLSMTYLLVTAKTNPEKVQKIFKMVYGDKGYFANLDYELYANYTLNNIEYKKLEDSIQDIADIETRNTILGLDELWQSADSRESITVPNKILSRFFAQSRKRLGDSSHIFHSAQYLHTIDIRMRNLTPYLIYPSIALYLDPATNRRKPVKNTDSDLPYLVELQAYKKAYLGDYEYVSSYPVKVIDIVRNYNYEEYIPPLRNTAIDELKTKYEKLIDNKEITTKRKLISMLVLDERLTKQNANILADRLF